MNQNDLDEPPLANRYRSQRRWGIRNRATRTVGMWHGAHCGGDPQVGYDEGEDT